MCKYFIVETIFILLFYGMDDSIIVKVARFILFKFFLCVVFLLKVLHFKDFRHRF